MTGRGVLLAVCMLSALLSRAASVGSGGGEGTMLHWQHATTRSRPHSVREKTAEDLCGDACLYKRSS